MANTTVQQIQGLANALPVANQQTQQQLDAARQIQMQQAIKAIPTSGVSQVQPAAQQLAVQGAQQQAAQQLQAQQTAQNQQTQLGQMALQAQGMENRQTLADKELANRKELAQSSQRLAQLDMKLKNEMLDKQNQFTVNQAGQTLLNEQQLIDFATLKAKNDVELNKYRQISEQASQRKIYLLQQANKVIQRELGQKFQTEQTALNNALQVELAKAQQALNDKIAKEQAEAANTQAKWQAGGTILGAAAGFAIGGPAGAAAGAAVGGGLGSVANQTLNK